MKSVSIFGVTGSVGQSTSDLIVSQPDMFDVRIVTANRNVSNLIQSAIQLKAKQAVVADESLYNDLKNGLAGTGIEALAGRQALLDVATIPVDWTMMAIVGMAGLEPLMAAIRRGGVIAIANKEPLVAAGALVMAAAERFGATILPVDSEHNAIFQVFDKNNRQAIERIILTASGGPFRNATLSQMKEATLEQALAHPNWSMGAKISIDSATMMNKALEVIEAHHLFSMPPDKIDVVVHPQSVIHSMVEYADGSVLAQLGAPDMRTPIAHTLAYPSRMATSGQRLDWKTLKRLDFEALDDNRFPAVGLAYDCLRAGQGECIAFNAANEIAVQAFLDRKIGFLDIVGHVSRILETVEDRKIECLEDVIAFDQMVRDMLLLQITGRHSGESRSPS
jgi:1-deoxy-D-xylulose-5-phosphate reductoisomerase